MDSAPNPRIAQFMAEGPHLNIWCYTPDCGRKAYLTAAEAQAAFGSAWRDFHRLNRIIVCSACGARARDKKVQAFPCSLDDTVRNHCEDIRKEIERYGVPQTQPLLLPGLGLVQPEDMGITWVRPGPRP